LEKAKNLKKVIQSITRDNLNSKQYKQKAKPKTIMSLASTQMIVTNALPLVCYKNVSEIELVEMPADRYIKFGDFEDIVLPSPNASDDFESISFKSAGSLEAQESFYSLDCTKSMDSETYYEKVEKYLIEYDPPFQTSWNEFVTACNEYFTAHGSDDDNKSKISTPHFYPSYSDFCYKSVNGDYSPVQNVANEISDEEAEECLGSDLWSDIASLKECTSDDYDDIVA